MANGKYGKTIHVRLQGAQLARFERVYANYRGLAASVVLRMILGQALREKTDAELQAIIDSGIRGEDTAQPKPHNRISDSNARRSRH